jgi:hypothetical protein
MTSPHDGRLVRERNTTLDKDRRGSVGIAVEPRRRKDKSNYPRRQAEEEDNVNHEMRQRGARHEETVGRTHNYASA